MKTQARWISGIALSLAVLVAMTVGLPVVHGQAAHVRWDIINIDFATLTVSAGGAASARANDCVPPGSTNCSKITLTGAGTFVAPAGAVTAAPAPPRAAALGRRLTTPALPPGVAPTR